MARPKKSITMKQATTRYAKLKEVIALDLSPLTEIPHPPDEFDKDEQWFYNTVCEALFNSGLLRSADLMTIESMAGWWSIMKKSQEDIRKNGMLQIAETGWQAASPSVGIFEKAWNKLKDFTDRYGFNLISKDKISAPPPKDLKAEKLKRMAR